MSKLYIYFDQRSPRKDGSGTLKVGLHHNDSTAYLSLGIHIKREEWDAKKCQVITRADKKFHNVIIRKTLEDCSTVLNRLLANSYYQSCNARELLAIVMRSARAIELPEDPDFVLPVYNEYISVCKKAKTAEIYRTSRNNLIEFEPQIDSLQFKDINVAWLRRYQNWLLGTKGMSVNGANVYMRNLRTIFNYAIQNRYTAAFYPFKNIDMSTAEPDKRTIAYEKFLDWVSIPMTDGRAYYRELFMLSFYLCGIRPVDLLHVKKSQVDEGRLVYWPQKLNGRTKLSIKIEPEAWEIIRKHEGREYLLDVMEKRSDYAAFCRHWNSGLKAIGEDYTMEARGKGGYHYIKTGHKGIIPYISAYYSRSCWASYAYNVLDIPMDVISQALGHKSGLRVTNFYVKRDGTKVDQVNRQLIDRIKKDLAERKAQHLAKEVRVRS